uniref:SLC12A transporter C-terminal domain-containing protein n=1 Tax=Romanomermis culicivorax TaxID=13658 RepID=A0A915J9Q4_ROMCU
EQSSNNLGTLISAQNVFRESRIPKIDVGSLSSVVSVSQHRIRMFLFTIPDAFPSFPQISSFTNGQHGGGSRKQSLGSTTSGATNPLLSLNGNNAVIIKVVDESEGADAEQGQPPTAKNVPTPYAVIVDESAATAAAKVEVGDEEKREATEETENRKKVSVKSEYLEQFRHKIKEPVIDVYWLFDDGGLTLLLPHILTQSKSYLEGGKMRVFTIASSRHQLEQEQRSMAALLSKFRIDYADVFVIPDITGRPKSQSQNEFRELIGPFLESGEIISGINNNNNKHLTITEAELTLQKDRTNRQLRIRELLLKHSMNSTLIVLTMPIPRRNVFSNILYMAWLEILTKDMPPVLLLRGNQQSVLTFYT